MWFHGLRSIGSVYFHYSEVLELACNQERNHVVDDVIVGQSSSGPRILPLYHCIYQVFLVCRMSSSLLDDATRD